MITEREANANAYYAKRKIELKKLHQEYKIEEEKKRIKFLSSSR